MASKIVVVVEIPFEGAGGAGMIGILRLRNSFASRKLLLRSEYTGKIQDDGISRKNGEPRLPK